MTMAADRSDIPPQRLVRHVFWKYPIIAAVLLIGISVIAAAAGSPNEPPETIAGAHSPRPATMTPPGNSGARSAAMRRPTTP